MSLNSLAIGGLNAIDFETVINECDERVTSRKASAIEQKQNKNSRFVPIRLKPEEAIKAHRCQKVMLKFAHEQYKNSIGTEKEASMRTMYHDAIADYKTFVARYEKELKAGKASKDD